MSVSAAVTDIASAVRDKLKGRVSQVKVRRYWPGKAPEWADDQGNEEEAERADSAQQLEGSSAQEDARLRRLEESRRDREDAIVRHRQIRQAEIVTTLEEEAEAKVRREEEEREDDEDEDAIEERRRRIRERLLQREKEQEAEAMAGEEGEEEAQEEEEEEESEYETDSDDEDGGHGIALIKPLFVPKSERDTIAEREKAEQEEQDLQEILKRKLEERKMETRQMVVEEIKREEILEKARIESEAQQSDVDTDDEVNEAEEYEAWKGREIGRIKREKESREASIKEREEIEKLRNMTEEERREWERKNPKELPSVAKSKWKFMQKYYHKGAFFQSTPDDRGGTAGTSEIYSRDYSAPTGEDKYDKSILPKIMQVKQFGRSGRTKWTHLVNEDTTQWESPWAVNDELRAKYNAKMAGMNRPIEKPKGSKKMKEWEKR